MKENQKPKETGIQEKPVAVGDVLNLPCVGIGKKGDGVFKYQGFIIMVPNAASLDINYRFKITRVMQRMAFGELVK